MDLKRVENFFEILNDTDIKELCWEKEGLKLRIKRNTHQPNSEGNPNTNIEAEQQMPIEEMFDQEIIKSKFVGSFILGKANKKIEIKAGDRVQNGQTLGYIEAMNIVKEIVSDVAGVVKEIKINPHDPVEYGQELFVIDIK